MYPSLFSFKKPLGQIAGALNFFNYGPPQVGVTMLHFQIVGCQFRSSDCSSNGTAMFTDSDFNFSSRHANVLQMAWTFNEKDHILTFTIGM